MAPHHMTLIRKWLAFNYVSRDTKSFLTLGPLLTSNTLLVVLEFDLNTRLLIL